MARSAQKTGFLYLAAGPALLALFLFAWSIPHSDLTKREAREGLPVKRMVQGASIWLPKIDDATLRTKPPLFYWSGLVSSDLLGGVSETSLRLPSALAGAATVGLTAWLGASLFSPATGALAAIILTTSWRFSFLGSHARIDMLFTFFLVLAFAAIWKTLKEPDPEARNGPSWLAALALGLAFLTKGPLALFFPIAALLLYRWLAGGSISIPWSRWILVPLGMALVWVFAGLTAGGEEFRQMIFQETVGRLRGDDSIQIHREPFYYYVPQLFLGLAPWSLFLPGALWLWRNEERRSPAWLFPASALATLFILLSLVPGKRGDYLLPVYPMASILIAHYFFTRTRRLLSHPPGLTIPVLLLSAFFLFLGTGLIFFSMVSGASPESWFPFLNARDRWMAGLLLRNHLPHPTVLVAVAGIMLLFAGGWVRALKNRSVPGIWGGTAGAALFILTIVHGPGAKVVNEYTTLKPFAQKVRKTVGSRPLAHYGDPRENLLYYLDRPVRIVHGDRAPRMLRRWPDTGFLVKSTQSRELLQKIPSLKLLLETEQTFKGYQLWGLTPFHPAS